MMKEVVFIPYEHCLACIIKLYIRQVLCMTGVLHVTAVNTNVLVDKCQHFLLTLI